MDRQAGETARLAIDGGPKAFEATSGQSRPKLGVAEFLSIAERFGFDPAALERIRAAVSDEDLAGDGPNLARYLCPFPPQTKGEALEAMAREMFGAKHALSVSSGTAAVHAGLVGLGAGPGTEVICPAVGFMATSAAVAMTGATPVFCDVDESFTMDPSKIEPLINERTVAVAPTHQWGGVCDLEPILAVAATHGVRVLEDCAQSPGGRYRGRYVGTIGDVGCFSISAYKIIGGGEGGLVITDDDRVFDRIRQLAECGGLWRPDRFAPPRYGGELFAGTNYRMSELEAAVNVVQLAGLGEVVERFHNVFVRVAGRLGTFRRITPRRVVDRDGWIGYELRFYPADHDLGRRIADALVAEGIGCGYRGADAPPDWHVYHHMFPVILEPATGRARWKKGDCPVADDLYDRSCVIGLNQWYSPADCDRIAAGINKVLSAYCTADESAAGWL
ncbi:MAG: DegT/DnrJ/EryC1/StrS family aminotransferase [Planctomycetota bacterium]|jgi:dTDP-4-amino-4,6-dideoxygalactose transaminase